MEQLIINTITIDHTTFTAPQSWNDLDKRNLLSCYHIIMQDTGNLFTPSELLPSKRMLLLQYLCDISDETCGGFVMTRAGEQTIGTVGRAFPGAEMKIDPANGEILARGPWFMDGYYKNPEKTAEAFSDGWYRMGDSGTISTDGYLHLTGRVSEIFKTAKGKFVVPAPIEWEFAANSDIEQICVTGLGLPQPIALVALSELGRAKAPSAIEYSLRESLIAVNQKLANYEKIATLIITRELWSVENGLLTPTLKVKRNELDSRYGASFEHWAAVPEPVVWED